MEEKKEEKKPEEKKEEEKPEKPSIKEIKAKNMQEFNKELIALLEKYDLQIKADARIIVRNN